MVGKRLEMRKTARILLPLLFLFGNTLYSFADRGLRKKSKSNINLNINTRSSFSGSLHYNLTSGLKESDTYSQFVKTSKYQGVNTQIKAYQKGNTVYLVSSKHKITSEVKPGYSGLKLTVNP